MKIITTRCRQFGHPKFVLEADEAHVPKSYLDNVGVTVEGMVSRGSVFRPGENFQIGWVLTQVGGYDEAHLTLAEPDMQSLPVRWVPGVTHTLRTLMLQLFMLDSVSLRQEMRVPVMTQSLIGSRGSRRPTSS